MLPKTRPLPKQAPDRNPGRRSSRSLLATALLAGAAIALGAPSVAADEYDPQRAGHPVRIIAYAAHPVGVILDLVLFRPAHWIGSLPVLDALFGHELYDH